MVIKLLSTEILVVISSCVIIILNSTMMFVYTYLCICLICRETPATNGIPSVTNPVAVPEVIPDTEQNQEKCRSSPSKKKKHKNRFYTNKDSTPEPEDVDNENVENLEVQKPEYHELLHIQKVGCEVCMYLHAYYVKYISDHNTECMNKTNVKFFL